MDVHIFSSLMNHNGPMDVPSLALRRKSYQLQSSLRQLAHNVHIEKLERSPRMDANRTRGKSDGR